MSDGELKTEIDDAPKAIRLSERRERSFRISNLNEKQRNLLNASASGVAGFSLGAVTMTFMASQSPKSGINDTDSIPENHEESVVIKIHTDAPIAEGVTDDMSFGEAFKTSRMEVGAGGIFEWRGNLYNTYYKEEWDAMGANDKAEFAKSIDPNYYPSTKNDEQEILDIVNDKNQDDLVILDEEDIIILDDDELIIDGDDDIVVVDQDDIILYETEDNLEDIAFNNNMDESDDFDDFDDFDDPSLV